MVASIQGSIDGSGGGADPGHDDITIEARLVRLGGLRVLSAVREAHELDSVVPSDAVVDVEGQRCATSSRFWKSIFRTYRFGASTFRYYHPQEVFSRVCEVSRDDALRVMIEHRRKGPPVALAVSRPRHALVSIEEIRELSQTYGATSSFYRNGVMSCTFTPKSGEQAQAIGGDHFANRFVLDVPIDGFGAAQIHVAILRLICANGAIGYNRAFASEIPSSKMPYHTLTRAIECFDHADGYAVLRERFLAAQSSWASVREAHTLYRQLVKTSLTAGAGVSGVLEDLDRLTGRVREYYGVTNLDTLPVRRQRLLPVQCRVYDLLNFASEVATHRVRPGSARPIQAWIGGVVADEFDLEGTAETVTEFADLLLGGDQSTKASSA